jgi:hypothetical protein
MLAFLPRLLLLLILTVPLGACGLIGGIFKAGFWTAVIVVVLIVAIVGFVARGRRGP